MNESSISLQQPAWLRVIAKIISIIFHPLFLPTYIFFWLLYRLPFEFSDITPEHLFERKITVFWMTAFFPAFAVFLLWRLKFIESVQMRTQRDRIIPYTISMFFYWWMWYLSRNFTDQPIVLKFLFLSMGFATVAGLILNNFFKISMHALAFGGIIVFAFVTSFYYQFFPATDIVIILLISGVVCTSRLILSEHTTFELYSGLFIGALCQILAYLLSQ